MIALSVNLNKVALLRNSRPGEQPDILEFASVCLENGCRGITVHPRPDQRHIRPSDCFKLKQLLEPLDTIELNLEGNPFSAAEGEYPGFLELVEQVRPDQCTLVPDSNDQLTSDHGFDLTRSAAELQPIIDKLKRHSIRVSLFMDPEIEQIEIAREIGADRIELYTGPFADAFSNDLPLAEAIFQQHCAAAERAIQIGLGVNAGHDLNLENLRLYRTLPGLAEVSIGHALTIDALRMGMASAISRYLDALNPEQQG